jgi:hypothetical protein
MLEQNFEKLCEYGFGKLPKRKYRLYISGALHYFFTTTIRTESECIEFMIEKVNCLLYDRHSRYSYTITSDSDGGGKEIILQQGKFQ